MIPGYGLPPPNPDEVTLLAGWLKSGRSTAQLIEDGWTEPTVAAAWEQAKQNGRAPGGSSAEPHPLITRAELDKLPQVEPLISGVLDRRGLTLLAGPWGCGKSFVALSMALSVATGKPWLGHPVKHTGPVLLVIREGLHGLRARIEAWEHANHGMRTVENLHIDHEHVNLTDPRSADRLVATTAKLKPALVVVDTLSRAMTGADENSAKDMSSAVETMTAVSDACDGQTQAVHHVGKDRLTVRGSSALEGGCDRVWMASGSPKALTLTATKTKDGAEPDPIRLELRDEMSSLVPILSRNGHGQDEKDEAVRLVLSKVCSWTPQGKNTLVETLVETLQISRSGAYVWVNTLVERGVLINVGSEKRPTYTVEGGNKSHT